MRPTNTTIEFETFSLAMCSIANDYRWQGTGRRKTEDGRSIA
jgi:hypothetical protein